MTLSKPLLQKVGWVVLVTTLIGILGAIGYLILITQRDVPVQQVAVSQTPATTAEALLAGSDDPEIEAEIEAALAEGKIAYLDTIRDEDEFGVATRLFENKIFSLEVIVSTIDPPAGYFYEVWLSDTTTKSVGRLVKEALEEDIYTLTFTSSEDLSSLDEIFITQETSVEELNISTETVLEGLF